MTQEEKDLLLKDLCARLPYGVKCHYTPKKEDDFDHKTDFPIRCIDKDGNIIPNNLSFRLNYTVEQVKPYLRPMSSMTEEEKNEYHKLCDSYYDIYFNSVESIDWLNAHHFDFHGLIEKGLAIAVTEENNPYVE